MDNAVNKSTSQVLSAPTVERKVEEPAITINGVALEFGQAMTVRVALNSFYRDIEASGLGDDVHGRNMTAAYMARLREIFALMAKRSNENASNTSEVGQPSTQAK